VNDSVAEAIASVTPPPAYSAQVFQGILPSLIFIQVEKPSDDGEIGHGVGSGVVINGDGDILTSLHVVDGATDIQLIYADGSEVSAQVIVEQPEKDIAVLHPNEPPGLIVPAILGNPNAMRIGDEAFVVGNPLGLYSSMSVGVISGFNRSFQPRNHDQKLEGLIQIDAAVNPGNSGGPLLNRGGQVIGIVTGLVNPTEQEVFIGIGFAVPIDVAAAAAGAPPY
jgi:S1-C subfamily serine protease